MQQAQDTATLAAASVLSVDLVDKAKEQIAFLQKLHVHGISIVRPNEESIRRYRDLWLPLLYQNQLKENHPMVPPGDIAWLWHCHRLAPYLYSSYLRARFGSNCPILEANPPFQFQTGDKDIRNDACLRTEAMWKEEYPLESFYTKEESNAPARLRPDASLGPSPRELWLGDFDIVSCTDRQATFLWQVSGPRFQDEVFLEEGFQNYCKFLELKQFAPPKQIIVPTYQIDLLWHTHILDNLMRYYQDTRRITGSTLNHDDGLSDRSEGGILDVCYQQTQSLWQEHYHEEYFVRGGMYRGEPPLRYYSRDWSASNEFDCTPTGPFLHMIDVQGASSTHQGAGAYSMQIRWCWKETDSQMQRHTPSSIVGDPSNCMIAYDSVANDRLEAAFQAQGGIGKCSPINGYVVDFRTMKQTKTSTGYEREVQRVIDTGVLDSPAVATLVDRSPALLSSTTATSTSDSKLMPITPATTDILVHATPSTGTNTGTPSVVVGPTVSPVVPSSNPGAYIWCWKETQSSMNTHSTDMIAGDPRECWIRYDDSATAFIESRYLRQEGSGSCEPVAGYELNFATMKQRKKSTGYERDVCRMVDPGSPAPGTFGVTVTPVMPPVSTTANNQQDQYIWCWKETDVRMGDHSADMIVGDPRDCWVRYDASSVLAIEAAYLSQGGRGTCEPLPGYELDFLRMKQKKKSTGYEREVCRMIEPPRCWLSANGQTASGQPAFIAAATKSTTKGVNANPKRDDYIFGEEWKGYGYYHVTTREAYKILHSRARQAILAAQQDLECRVTCHEIFACGLGGKPACITNQEAKIDELHLEKEVIAARSIAPSPQGMVGIPSSKIRDPQTTRKYYSDTGMWLFPSTFYTVGGGCGAGMNTTGVAACGIASCGGFGGCGGGGCGGGGCGGGGGGCGGG